MTFEQPIKGDLDRALSLLMHDHRHELMAKCNLIKSDAVKIGALHGNRVVVMAMKAADDLHKEAMTQASTILLDYIGRMQSAPAEIVGWARPHLENLGNSLLGVVPPNNFPQDHQRLVQQYRAVFGQRLDGMLRDVEIGFVRGAGFARAQNMESTEREAMAAKKRPGNVRELSELAGSILQDVRGDFLTKGYSWQELANHYVGINLADLQQKHCTQGGHSQVDFDLALKELETALFVNTGPMVPFDNKPGSGVFALGLYSKREYVYLTEAGYRAASQMANQKPGHAPHPHVHISGGTFHQSQIGIGDQVTQMQRVDIDKDVGNALTALTQAIASEHSIPNSEREALLEQIAYLSEQAAHPAKDRKLGMIKATLGAVSQAASTVASVASAWQTAGPLLKQYFGS